MNLTKYTVNKPPDARFVLMKHPQHPPIGFARHPVIPLTWPVVPPARFNSLGPLLEGQLLAPAFHRLRQQPAGSMFGIINVVDLIGRAPAPSMFGLMVGVGRYACQSLPAQASAQVIQKLRPVSAVLGPVEHVIGRGGVLARAFTFNDDGADGLFDGQIINFEFEQFF